jgi:prophage regulatory protein
MKTEFLRPKDCARLLGIGLSTFWRWAAEGRFPKGIRLSNRATVWRREVLESFISAREGGRHE